MIRSSHNTYYEPNTGKSNIISNLLSSIAPYLIQKADAFAERYFKLIDGLQKSGLNLGQIAEALNAGGHVSRRGALWTYHSVSQVIKRAKKVNKETKSIGIRSEVMGEAPGALRQAKHMGKKRIIGWDRL